MILTVRSCFFCVPLQTFVKSENHLTKGTEIAIIKLFIKLFGEIFCK